MDINLKTISGQPSIQVNTFKKQKHVDLHYNPGDFDLFDLGGKKLFEGEQHPGKWRIKVKQGKSLSYDYFLILKESKNRTGFDDEFGKFKGVRLHHVGGKISIDAHVVTSNDKYLLVAGPFASEREARHHSQDYAQVSHCRIYRQIASGSSGVLEIFDPEYEVFTEVQNGFQLIPKTDAEYYTIKHIAIQHQGINKTEYQDLSYQGSLKLRIDEENTLMGINEVGIETYLKGVLHSEIGDHINLEYAKSMAIVARSQIFSRIGQMHALEGFDFCSDSHCLRYYGRRVDNAHIDQAILETRGLILSSDSRVCPSYFHYSCGGHTEHASAIWQDGIDELAKGKADSANQKLEVLDLKDETNLKKWILDRPDVLCKTDGHPIGGNLDLASDAFRWDIFYTRKELEEIIFEKTGEELGVIYDLHPRHRGVSGRITELEILSSLKNISIKGEQNICSALSETVLNSSCFFIETEMDMDGVPINFLFVGAGKGHGVGLCKVGAAKMSENGQEYKKILAHYFGQCTINRIYT